MIDMVTDHLMISPSIGCMVAAAIAAATIVVVNPNSDDT